ncbi:hypothetical protein Glove_219g194 [Diversispora epigaea]|uniref:Uncharacterized protein n=1 Tax=Diversispora epigaea TaxID=1348612 RepID=A0A397INM8_9GLOM|nr:hypothetical protein Glove_219g194 [Diversispora epigaea]
MNERKQKAKENIISKASNIIDTVKNRHSKKAKYVNSAVPMEQDLETTASTSNTSLGTVQSTEEGNMEITPSKEATPERNINKGDEETTINEIEKTITERDNQKNKQQEEDYKGKKVINTNPNENTQKVGFITLYSNKGKDKETDMTEGTDELDKDDAISIESMETNLSEHEKWKIETNAKRYKAWIKIHSLKGKNLREKTTYLLDEIKKNEIQWINLSREKNLNEKGIHLSLTFDNEEELQRILKLELETTETNTKTKMIRAPLTRKNRFTTTNSVVKFWDVPIKTNRQDFLRMIENKFGKIKSNLARLNGLYHTFWIEFKTQGVAEEILTQKSQIVENECVCVTTPEIKYADLLKLKETGFATKALDVPQTMSPAELYTIMMQIEAQTCYMPLTRNGNRKGLAILNLESQEILDAAMGKGYYVDQHVIKIVTAETKICHQCKSMDHLVKDCQIVKEIKEREFRQKQNYQKFNQTYRKYQPRIYNTLSNRYTN